MEKVLLQHYFSSMKIVAGGNTFNSEQKECQCNGEYTYPHHVWASHNPVGLYKRIRLSLTMWGPSEPYGTHIMSRHVLAVLQLQ